MEIVDSNSHENVYMFAENRNWSSSDSFIAMELSTDNLQLNSCYTLTINVSNLAGYTFREQSFSEYLVATRKNTEVCVLSVNNCSGPRDGVC